MLNGIGGRTIAEAKECMSQSEAVAWSRYIRRYGSLNTGTRIEQSIALLCVALLRSQGVEADIKNFMPHTEKPEPKTADIASVFNMFRAIQKQK